MPKPARRWPVLCYINTRNNGTKAYIITMNVMKHRLKLMPNQSGMAAIIVTLIIMIVLSLITLGFARIVNREQRQVADRQLNTQAFYAAESGVSIVKNLSSLPDTGLNAN